MIDAILKNRQLRESLAAIHPGGDQEEAVARIIWSTIAEPNDAQAGALIAEHGATTALRIGLGLDDPTTTPSTTLLESMTRWRTQEDAPIVNAIIHRSNGLGARLMIPGDSDWPTALDDLGAHVPFLLWVRGNAGLLNAERRVAITGSRAATGYGEMTARDLSSDMASNGTVVIGTGAYGIDAAAHRGALAVGGKTIAVLASGVDRPFPHGHSELLRRIAEQGAVVSEVPLGIAPSKWRFLSRNRVAAAAAQAVVVVEAGYRSGTLNLAGHARAGARPGRSSWPHHLSGQRRVPQAHPRAGRHLYHECRRRQGVARHPGGQLTSQSKTPHAKLRGLRCAQIEGDPMSQDHRDQRGGHPRRKSDWKSCQCCPNLPRHARNRTRRNRQLERYERRAEGSA